MFGRDGLLVSKERLEVAVAWALGKSPRSEGARLRTRMVGGCHRSPSDRA